MGTVPLSQSNMTRREKRKFSKRKLSSKYNDYYNMNIKVNTKSSLDSHSVRSTDREVNVGDAAAMINNER